MIQDFNVKTLFEDQFHERQQFTLTFAGDTYQGIFHNEDIHWLHPQPHTKLVEGDIQDLESKVYDLLTNHVDQDFTVKPLFEDQVPERHQFALNFDGANYQGIFHNEEIQWLHPQPKHQLEKVDLVDLESKVHDLMTHHVYQDFKVKPLFEDQFHERHQFELNHEGDSYQGIFHNEEIHWLHPQPKHQLEEDDLQDLESKVYDLMTNHINQDFQVKPLFEDQQ
ncbi:DUF5342 family protein [Peribacillus loiseleuriae]|nr:DUF5342 family protein [Peribacillus loiseleuriae]